MAAGRLDVSGRVCLVTGGNRGIGFGMAEGLAEAGASLVIWGSNADRNEAAAERLKQYGVRVMAQTVDVGSECQVVDSMAELVGEMGHLDFAVANAGVGVVAKSFVETTTELVRAVMKVNVDGVFWTLREACRYMVKRVAEGGPGGSLAAVASLAATRGATGSEVYSASKGAVVALTKAIAVEHAQFGIRANTIVPGWVATDMTAPILADDALTSAVLSRIPAGRLGTASDFGGLAVYLASPASAYHTGDIITIDGAYSAS